MTAAELRRIVPNASAATLAANGANDLRAVVEKPTPRRGRMNKTESAFARLLESQKLRGEIDRYEFEGITLRYAFAPGESPLRYTPDFLVSRPESGARHYVLIEVKGAHIFPNALIRFRSCRACWPEFQFELWQFKDREWRRIH